MSCFMTKKFAEFLCVTEFFELQFVIQSRKRNVLGLLVRCD